mmetsp:Transcript_39929/g.68919  ORF Transcript_39929/g.68919 Transcript_39929/m.68919 type:complete len:250 (+) Transcript_39929:84-833(+)
MDVSFLQIIFLLACLWTGTHGRISSPSQFHEQAFKGLAGHLGADEEGLRDLISSHPSYSTLCDDFSSWSFASASTVFDSWSSNSSFSKTWSSSWTSTTDGIYDCACGCEAFSLNFTDSKIYCQFQSFTEAMNGCFESDDVDSCGDLCSDTNAETLFENWDCWWAWYHKMFWHYDLCDNYNSSSYHSTTSGYTCPIMAQGTFETSSTDFCDDYSSTDEDQTDAAVFPAVNPGPLALFATVILSLAVEWWN